MGTLLYFQMYYQIERYIFDHNQMAQMKDSKPTKSAFLQLSSILETSPTSSNYQLDPYVRVTPKT